MTDNDSRHGDPVPLVDRPPGPWLQSDRAWQILIALASAAVFAQTVAFGWVYDDQLEIVRNVLIRSLSRLPEIFGSTAWAGSGMETYLYRPLALATYALNYQISTLEAWSYHLVNVLLHAGVSLLVFRIGRLWGLSPWAAGIGGVVFAVHPVHVEVAAAVFGRKDLLATLFSLVMILCHRAALDRGSWRGPLAVAAYAAALLSKEVGAIGLGLVLAHDVLLKPGGMGLSGSRRAHRLYIAYLGALLLYLFVRNTVTGAFGIPQTSPLDNPLVAVDLLSRIATATVVIGRGLTLLAAPVTLSPDYSFNAIPVVTSVFDPRLLLVTTGLCLLTWWLFTRRHSMRTVIPLAVAWYAVSILPASNLLLPVGTIFGERLLYLPSVSFCLLVGAGAEWLSHRRPRITLLAMTIWLTGLLYQTLRYSSAWENDISLFQWAAASVPASTKAHHKLGEEQLRAGLLGDAVRSLTRALDIAPQNEFASQTMGIAKRQIADRYLPPPMESGEPGNVPSDPDILYVLGQLSREDGDLEGARSYWEKALASAPQHPESLADLALFRVAEADTATALNYLTRAVRGKPSLASAWFNLGRISLALGDVPQAKRAFQEFLRVSGPRFPNQVQWAQQTLRELETR